MEAVALRPAAAFWRQFIVREVGPLPRDAVEELLRRNLGRPISAGALSLLWEFTQGIPFYVQFVGRELSRRGEQAVTEGEVEQAVEEFLREEGGILFQEQWQRLSAKERKVLQAMAKGHATPSDIAREAVEPPNTVSQYLRYLAEKELVIRVGPGRWRIADQVFARWLRDRLE